MSHYTVLCVTQGGSDEELEALLDPYDENGHMDEFVVDDEYDGGGYHRNPLAKWDWWVVGGRWSNELMRKDGRLCDSAAVGDLALDAMRLTEAMKGEQKWAEVDGLIAGLAPAVSYDALMESHGPDRDVVREAFWAQPRMAALQALDAWGAYDLLDEYQTLTRDEFIEKRALQAVPGYALLTAEGWMARGEMGWFGCGSDTLDSSLDYLRTANKFIDALPDTAWLTMVDCHI